MANPMNRCPRCGRIRRQPNNNAGNGCGFTPSVSSELYAGSVEEPDYTSCCDYLYGCRIYDRNNRCRYWPGFCHPRWLPCHQLYSCVKRPG